MPEVRCPYCNATGKRDGKMCRRCLGTGKVWIDTGSGR